MTSPDTLWLRAFWHVYEGSEQFMRENNIAPNQQTVEFADVDRLVLEWSKMPIDQLLQMLNGEH